MAGILLSIEKRDGEGEQANGMGDTPHVRGKMAVSIEELNSMPNIPFDYGG